MKYLISLFILISSLIAQNYGKWIELDTMNVARIGHAMVELPNGNILGSGNGVDSIQSNAEIYDFSKGEWKLTTPMIVPRDSHFLILLNTGKVLAIGGYKEKSCELFDPVSETWSMTDSIPTYRWFKPSVTELANGNILVAGGGYIDTTTWESHIFNNVEMYNITTESWEIVAPMSIKRRNHVATLLLDGRVLVTGGFNKNLNISSCEIYDPIENTWTQVSSLIEARYMHSAILLKNGNVLISGGNPTHPWLKSCEVYNIKTDQWSSASDMLSYRFGHYMYYLSQTDKIFILGGDVQPESTEDTWEIYNPNDLEPIYKDAFPINQFLMHNIQLTDENIFIAGGEEYTFIGDLPYTRPSKKSWKFDIVTDVKETEDRKQNIFLSPNYPNPFNPTTRINYTLQKSGFVNLTITNLLGEIVLELENNYKQSGDYSFEFDGSDLSSGTYFYILRTDEHKEIRKMILIK